MNRVERNLPLNPFHHHALLVHGEVVWLDGDQGLYYLPRYTYEEAMALGEGPTKARRKQARRRMATGRRDLVGVVEKDQNTALERHGSNVTALFLFGPTYRLLLIAPESSRPSLPGTEEN
jgi:hypothetical protein